MHKVAEKVLIITGMLTLLTGMLNAQEIESEMRSFFIEALKDNYGEKSEKDLFYDFFEEYHTKKGNIELEYERHF